MKQTFALLLTGLIVVSCSKSSSTSKGGQNATNPYTACSYDYYTNPACPGYTSGGATSGSTTGTTTGGTSGGSYGALPDSVNNWTSRYNTSGKPSAPSTPSCSTPVNQASGTNYAPRKGTIHMAFRKNYSPDVAGLSGFSNSISTHLTDVNASKMFLDSDGLLKVRFMPRPQRVPSNGDVWCFGRTVGSGSGTAYGYTQLSYSVAVRGVLPNGSLTGYLGTQYLTTNIQTCSPAIDFSGYAQSYPDGIVLSVFDVYSNQGCSQHPCSSWSQVSTTCWGMDVEVATDNTQTF